MEPQIKKRSRTLSFQLSFHSHGSKAPPSQILDLMETFSQVQITQDTAVTGKSTIQYNIFFKAHDYWKKKFSKAKCH